MANILNLELDIPETEQGPGYGGAILAAVGCGAFVSVEEASKKLVRVAETIVPDAEIADRYDKKYQVFRELYPTLKSFFPKFA